MSTFLSSSRVLLVGFLLILALRGVILGLSIAGLVDTLDAVLNILTAVLTVAWLILVARAALRNRAANRNAPPPDPSHD
jgi:glycopeptide antibiotics resistance protein